MSHLTDEQIESMKENVAREIVDIVQKLGEGYPGINEGLGTMIGATTGAGFSYIALYLLGVHGLSAAGITSGLAAAGTVVGGHMVAGIGVLAAPITILAVVGYAFAKYKKSVKLADDLKQAVIKFYKIQDRLSQDTEDFKNGLNQLKTIIEFYKNKEKETLADFIARLPEIAKKSPQAVKETLADVTVELTEIAKNSSPTVKETVADVTAKLTEIARNSPSTQTVKETLADVTARLTEIARNTLQTIKPKEQEKLTREEGDEHQRR